MDGFIFFTSNFILFYDSAYICKGNECRKVHILNYARI
jgi:hypothetical protein